jgi:hypothetical protein
MIQHIVKYADDLLWTLRRIAMAQEARARLERHRAISNALALLGGTWATEQQRAEAQAILDELGARP